MTRRLLSPGIVLNHPWRMTVLTGVGSAALVLAGCSSSSDAPASSATVSLSGTINTASSSGLNLKGHPSVNALTSAPSAFSLVGYKVQCTTMEDPPQVITADVADDGSFSVAGVPPNAVGCQILDADGNPAAPIVLKDPSEKDMKGQEKTLSRVQLASDADLGTVTFDPEAGTASSTISEALKDKMSATAISSPVDFTGSYIMDKFDGTLPTGYISACTAEESQNGNCNGPSEGEHIYIKMLTGKAFTPDTTCSSAVTAGTLVSGGTCDGTTGTSDKYAIEVWSSHGQWATCGNKLGFSYAEAKGYGGIDLTSSGVDEGTHVWSTSDGNSGTITDGWKFSIATTDWSMQDCESTTVNGVGAWKCYDRVQGTYQVNLNAGGCKGSDGKAVNNIDWNTVNWSSSNPTSENYDTVNFPGYTKTTQTPTYNGQAITCVNISGVFHISNNTAANMNQFNWSNVTNLIAQNAACSSITANTSQKQLIQLQCYANAMWGNQTIRSMTQSGNLCLRKVRANWGTDDPTKFIENHGPIKAEGQHVAELFDYTSASSGTFRMREDDYRGVQNGNSWTTCHLENAITISMKQRADGNLNLEFVQETKNLDAGIAACKSAESDLRVGTSRMLFKVVKQ